MSDESDPSLDGLERIWTPHRMAYVRTAVDDEGCPFCAIPGHPDEESLVVARGDRPVDHLRRPQSALTYLRHGDTKVCPPAVTS